MVDEHTPLSRLLGPTATNLAKGRDLHTVGDLLSFWPRRQPLHICARDSKGDVWPG